MKDKIKSLQTSNDNRERIIESSMKLIARLGVISKGNSKELDNKLAKLRKFSQKGSNDEQLLTAVQGCLSSTTELEKNKASIMRELKESLVLSGEALQETKGLEPDTRRNLRMVMNKLKSQESFILIEIQPLAVALLTIYKKTISNVAAESADSASIDKGILKALVDGMNKLAENDVIKPRLKEFSDRMEIARDDSEKLDLCLKFFDEVVSQFGEEYNQTQKLIANINSALEDVHQTLLKSISSSKNYGVQLQKLNVKIDEQIAELSRNAEEATSITQLQSLIDKKLDGINESIKERDGIEKKRTLELDSTLQEMESKLAALEQRTEYYRQKWLEEKVKSDTDSLTGLPNRGAYDKRFDEEFNRWVRNPEPLCLAVLDIDHFKKINDKYGHSVGDKTLQIVSKTLRKSLRTTDYLARYGGEEFVCLMLNTNAKDAQVPLEKIRKAVEKIPFKVKDDRLNITISIGVTMLLASDNVHTVFDRADKALYKAKDTGRNKICYKK